MVKPTRSLWHGLARAYVLTKRGGYSITELNCDTPTGEAEAVVLSALALELLPRGSGLSDPNSHLDRRFGPMGTLLIRPLLGGPAPPPLGLGFPTEVTEEPSATPLYPWWPERRCVVARV